MSPHETPRLHFMLDCSALAPHARTGGADVGGSIATPTVAILYCDERGPYPKLSGVDCWGITRDARLYDGPWPVVAHPPCAHYSKLRHLAETDDADCAIRAAEQVRRFGGVLEHPAGSHLFDRMTPGYLPWPGDLPDPWGGVTIEVQQCEFGHVARKRTWLYLVGVPSSAIERAPFPGRAPTHWCSGFRSSTGRSPEHYAKNGCAVPPGIKVCSAQQRRRTPPLFAEYLVRLARSVRSVEASR